MSFADAVVAVFRAAAPEPPTPEAEALLHWVIEHRRWPTAPPEMQLVYEPANTWPRAACRLVFETEARQMPVAQVRRGLLLVDHWHIEDLIENTGVARFLDDLPGMVSDGQISISVTDGRERWSPDAEGIDEVDILNARVTLVHGREARITGLKLIAEAAMRAEQSAVNAWVLDRARREGRKLKQVDAALRQECVDATGATWDQVTEAFRTLPLEFRYSRGRPRKSSARFRPLDARFRFEA